MRFIFIFPFLALAIAACGGDQTQNVVTLEPEPTSTDSPTKTPIPPTPEPITVIFDYFESDGIRSSPRIENGLIKPIEPGDELLVLAYQERPYKAYLVRLSDGSEGWLLWKMGMFEPLEDGQVQVYADATATPSSAFTPCRAAFKSAAEISSLNDTVEDLDAAVNLCGSLDEWTSASEAYPAALDGVDPETFLRNRCQFGNFSADSLCGKLN